MNWKMIITTLSLAPRYCRKFRGMPVNTAFTLVALLSLLLFSGEIWATEKVPTKPRNLTISSSFYESDKGKSNKLADTFIDRIATKRNVIVERMANCHWLKTPEGTAAGSHVNLLELTFGKRIELLALMPSKDGKAITFAARAPALVQSSRPQMYKASPGDFQFAVNAPYDLVANFAANMSQQPKSKGTCQLILDTWDIKQEGNVLDLGAGQFTPSANFKVNKIHPLAVAAMHAEAYRASTATQKKIITLSFRLSENQCDIRARLQVEGDAAGELKQYGVSYEKLYDTIRVLTLNLLEWQGNVDNFYNPLLEVFHPLFTTEIESAEGSIEEKQNAIIGRVGNDFAALSSSTGKLLWQTSFETTGETACRNNQLFRFTYHYCVLSRISTTTGNDEFSLTLKSLPSINNVISTGDFWALVANKSIQSYSQDKNIWRKDLTWPIQAGSLIKECGIVVGDIKGNIIHFSLDGTETWKVKLPHPAVGKLYFDSGLIFACDNQQTIYVIDDTGKILWQVKLNDVLVGSPQVVGDQVVIGTKYNEILVFDRVTGKCLKKHKFKTWLIASRVIAGSLLCITRDKKIHIFDLETFKSLEILRFPFQLNGNILPIKKVSLGPGHNNTSMANQSPGYIISDLKGFMYFGRIYEN